MNLPSMISEIIQIIDQKYDTENECFDIDQIKILCKLCKIKNTSESKIDLTDITFSTPDIKKITCKENKQILVKINTPEFQKIYSLFIKILYSCLKLEVEIFNTDKDNCYTIKNNYQLIRSIELRKKKDILEHIEVLKMNIKKISSSDTIMYEKHVNDHLVKMKILNKLIGWISVFEKNNNLFSLILPYFYKYTQYIEEYVG